MDMAPPDLPDTLPDIELKCPSDFDEHALVPPNATDDCDKSVVVEREVQGFDKCKADFDVVWTAIDDCSKTDSVSQKVRFTGTTLPTIACPANATFTNGGDTFTHAVSYGDCYTAADISIEYDATCYGNDGEGCTVKAVPKAAGLTISGAPAGSRVDWTARLNYGCGVIAATCSAHAA